MPFMQKDGRLYYISRRSLCDNCKIIGCPDRNNKTSCPNFTPEKIIFVECEWCGVIFEMHEAMKSDTGTLCSKCKRLRRDDQEHRERDE